MSKEIVKGVLTKGILGVVAILALSFGISLADSNQALSSVLVLVALVIGIGLKTIGR